MSSLDRFNSRRRAGAGMRVALAAAAVLGVATACSSSAGTEPGQRVPVRLSVIATSPPPTAGGAVVTSVRLSIERAALGGGEEFGCKDCNDEGNDDGGEPSAAQVVRVSPGAPVLLATEPVQPGRYAQAEIELAPPAGSTASGWTPGSTIELAGTMRGAPFTVALSVRGTLRETLSPAVVVSALDAASPASVTISLPVASWLVGANGEGLDPTNPTARAQIEANVRRSLLPPESDRKR